MAGRPTLLTPELIEKAKGYLATCVEYQNDGTNKTVRLPSIEGLALFLEVGRSVIYDWRDNKNEPDPILRAEFMDILEKVLATQASFLLNNGLNGNYNSTISKLILGKHGYVDQKDITSDGKAIGTLDEARQAAIDSAVTKHLNANKGNTDGK